MDGIKILALDTPTGRLKRMLGLTWRAFLLARREKADVCHFHDPELLPVMVLLKLTTHTRVIYDVHENYYESIKTKTWIPLPLRLIVGITTRIVETVCCAVLDSMVCATDSIKSRFNNRKAITIKNMPITRRPVVVESETPRGRDNSVVFVGNLDHTRGVLQLVTAMGSLGDKWRDVRLNLVGRFSTPMFEINY